MLRCPRVRRDTTPERGLVTVLPQSKRRLQDGDEILPSACPHPKHGGMALPRAGAKRPSLLHAEPVGRKWAARSFFVLAFCLLRKRVASASPMRASAQPSLPASSSREAAQAPGNSWKLMEGLRARCPRFRSAFRSTPTIASKAARAFSGDGCSAKVTSASSSGPRRPA